MSAQYGESWRWEEMVESDAIYDADNRPVLASWGAHGYESGLHIDAEKRRRLLACVNALAGLPTEALESGVIEEIVTALADPPADAPGAGGA